MGASPTLTTILSPVLLTPAPSGCIQERVVDHGRGECLEVTRWPCVLGEDRCVTDGKGCESRSCDSEEHDDRRDP